MLGQILNHAQHPFGAAFTNGFHSPALLQQFTRDIQRQVRRVDHAFDEAQVGWHQRLCVVHDENAFDVQLDARSFLTVEHIHRGFAGDEQQLGVLGRAFNPVVCRGQRRLLVVANLLIKLVVLLRRDVFFSARPQGCCLVDRFPLAGFHHAAGLTATVRVSRGNEFAVLPLFFFHQNGQRDVV